MEKEGERARLKIVFTLACMCARLHVCAQPRFQRRQARFTRTKRLHACIDRMYLFSTMCIFMSALSGSRYFVLTRASANCIRYGFSVVQVCRCRGGGLAAAQAATGGRLRAGRRYCHRERPRAAAVWPPACRALLRGPTRVSLIY